MSGKAFISYSQPDRECAFELVAALEEREVKCWIAPRDVTPGEDWAAEIIHAIGNASVMILVFSSHSNTSAQVRREVERAVHKNVRIVPFRIEDVLPSDSLEYFLSTQHWLDAFPAPRAPHYSRLCDYLKRDAQQSAPPKSTPLRSPQKAGNSRFDAATLSTIERALAQHVGPIARVLISRRASSAADIASLCAELSSEVGDGRSRAQFLESCKALGA